MDSYIQSQVATCIGAISALTLSQAVLSLSNLHSELFHGTSANSNCYCWDKENNLNWHPPLQHRNRLTNEFIITLF